MSFEYAVSFTRPLKISLPELGNIFQSLGHYKIVRVTDSEVYLAYARVPTRSEWPEDIVVEINGSQLNATIHAGTRQQRDRFLSDLVAVLTETGVTTPEVAEL